MFEINGDRVDDGKKMMQDVDLWRRDPVECIKELIANPAFCANMQYELVRVYNDVAGGPEHREWSQMRTADWWCDIQVS